MKYRLPSACLSVLVGTIVSLPPAAAQMRGGHGGGAGPRMGGAYAGGGYRGGRGGGFDRGQGGFFPGFLTSGYYPFGEYDTDYDWGYQFPDMPPQPQEFHRVVALPPGAAPAAQPAESLLLELHGDQWVRVAGYSEMAGSGQMAPPSAAPAPGRPATPEGRREAAQPAAKLAPAVLVLRDQHTEEIESYTIMRGVIYINSEDWTTGSHTRRIPLAQLDIPATLKVNRDPGGNFELPSKSYEVMLRP